jgi:hypothetical protein
MIGGATILAGGCALGGCEASLKLVKSAVLSGGFGTELLIYHSLCNPFAFKELSLLIHWLVLDAGVFQEGLDDLELLRLFFGR